MSEIIRTHGVTVFEVDQEYDSLDERALGELSTQLLNVVETANPPVLLLDLARTKFIGSSFLGVLIRAWKRLRDRNGQMALCNVNNLCSEVLQASKLNSIWDVYGTREAAIQGLAAESA